jgi:flagellar FliL protein
MAKAPAAATADASAAAPSPPKSKKLLLIVMAAVLVVVVLVAAVVVLLLLKKSGAGEDAKASEEAHATVDLAHPPTFVSLDPFVVNLAPAEGDRYLQVVLALRVGDPKTGDSLKGFMPEIRHRINLLLSSKLPSELSTAEGRELLADEIVDETNSALGAPPPGKDGAVTGPIQAVLFNSFIIQ